MLKVHKNKNLFGSDFEFCTISFLNEGLLKKVFWSGHIGEDRIIPQSLRLSRIEFSLVSD